jgi:hypothetical protein
MARPHAREPLAGAAGFETYASRFKEIRPQFIYKEVSGDQHFKSTVERRPNFEGVQQIYFRHGEVRNCASQYALARARRAAFLGARDREAFAPVTWEGA